MERLEEFLKLGTAVLVIDMLNDFVLEGAPLQVPGAMELAQRIAPFLEEARKRGVPVIYICDHHDPDDEEFRRWPKHCVRGTEGAKVVDPLRPKEGDRCVPKRRYSGFFETNLDDILRELGAKTLVLTGLLTDVCVLLTAVDAGQRGYEVVVPKDLTIALSEEDKNWALRQMERLVGAKVV